MLNYEKRLQIKKNSLANVKGLIKQQEAILADGNCDFHYEMQVRGEIARLSTKYTSLQLDILDIEEDIRNLNTASKILKMHLGMS